MKIPTTNFALFLDKIRTDLVDYISDDDFYALHDNIYLIEKKLLERDFEYFEIHIRWISEILFSVLKYKLLKVGIPKATVNQIYAKQIVNLSRLKGLETLDSSSEYKEFIKLKDLGNDYAHARFTHTGEWYSEIRINTQHIDVYIKYTESLHDVLKWLLDMEHVFNRALYYPTDLAIANPKYKYLFDYKDTTCKLCGEGHLTIPERVDGEISMPYGPYLICDHCGSILSANLKLKEDMNNLKDHLHCMKCDTVMKRVYDYKKDIEYYACTNNKCTEVASADELKRNLEEEQDKLFNEVYDSFSFEDTTMEDITKPREEGWDDSVDPWDLLEEEEDI